MKKILINGRLALMGEVEFIQKEIFGLKPGDKIIQIGVPGKNGKETSSARIDEFTLPLTYKGLIKLEDEAANGMNIVFEVPAEGVSGFEENETPQPVYLLYLILDEKSGELMLNIYNNKWTVRFYRSKFIKAAA